jgi:hypothetical protein
MRDPGLEVIPELGSPEPINIFIVPSVLVRERTFVVVAAPVETFRFVTARFVDVALVSVALVPIKLVTVSVIAFKILVAKFPVTVRFETVVEPSVEDPVTVRLVPNIVCIAPV